MFWGNCCCHYFINKEAEAQRSLNDFPIVQSLLKVEESNLVFRGPKYYPALYTTSVFVTIHPELPLAASMRSADHVRKNIQIDARRVLS